MSINMKRYLSNILKNVCHIRISTILKCAWYIFLAFMVLEFVIINCVCLFVYKFITNELSQMTSQYRNPTILERLTNNRRARDLLTTGKEGGFVYVIQESLERLYIVHEDSNQTPAWTDVKGRHPKAVSFLGIDVSHSGESSYLYRRIMSRRKFPFHFFIVDIGANDGLISSNSFNYIQWGWDAVLVEPQSDQMKMAKINIRRYMDSSSDQPQTVKFVQAVIGEKDGSVQFVRKPNTFGTESHILFDGQSVQEGETVVTVPSLSVKSLSIKYAIPKNFGILSIDAEGFSAKILMQWLNADFRPAYIIFEKLHRQESLSMTTLSLENSGYHLIATRGWNMIFEHTSLA